MDLSFCVGLRSDFPVVRRDTAEEPLSVPEDFPAARSDLLRKLPVPGCVFTSAQVFRQRTEVLQGPEMQKAHHRALPASQIQTVVPVGPQSFADPVLSDLPRGEIENTLQMLINSSLAAVGIAEHFIDEFVVTGFTDILNHRTHQPQCVVGAGVPGTMDNLASGGSRDNRRRFEGLLLFLRFKPSRLKQVQAVALCSQRPQQLNQAFPALSGI